MKNLLSCILRNFNSSSFFLFQAFSGALLDICLLWNNPLWSVLCHLMLSNSYIGFNIFKPFFAIFQFGAPGNYFIFSSNVMLINHVPCPMLFQFSNTMNNIYDLCYAPYFLIIYFVPETQTLYSISRLFFYVIIYYIYQLNILRI